MLNTRYAAISSAAPTIVALVISLCFSVETRAQNNGSQSADFAAQAARLGAQSVNFNVSAESQRIEMVVNTSRILTLDHSVPRLLVQNTDVIKATPLSPNQVQIFAQKPGVTSISLWDENDKIQVVDVRVYGDVRELQDNLQTMFPEAKLKLRTLNSSLWLSGYVPRAEMVSKIVEVSEEYFPKVINDMNVGGAQTVLLHVKVVEVSRTKLRRLGIDWAYLNSNDFIVQSASSVLNPIATAAGTLTGAGDTVRVGVVGRNGTQFGAFVNALRQNNLAKLLAEPTLITVSGRAASFNSGGQIPVPVTSGIGGGTSVEYREFGTTIDFIPIVLGNGMIKLEVRPEITEVDQSLRDPITLTPGFRSRRVDTAVEMRAGQTMALAGLLQTRVDSENTGLPWLADLPWFGVPFRRVQETVNEVELVIMVTPELVSPLEPHEIPGCGPGQSTGSPSDIDLFFRGYNEVPKCCPDGSCAKCRGGAGNFGPIGSAGPGSLYEEVSPGVQKGAYQSSAYQGSTYNRVQNNPTMVYGSGTQNTSPDTVNYIRSNSTSAPAPQAAPIRTPTNNQYNSYVPQQRYQTPTQPTKETSTANQFEPTLIGPLGYDVLK